MNATPKHVVYLYSEVMPYVITVMRCIRDNHHAEIHCVYWNENKKTPFHPADEKGIHFYKRSTFDENSLIAFIESNNPHIIYVSGRMDASYLKAVKHFRNKGIAIVSGSDNQWKGTLKNHVASLFGKQLYRKYFDYMWVAGDRQQKYAKRIGYKDEEILMGLLSADINLYTRQFEEKKHRLYPKAIGYAGRFAPEKGIDILVKAFEEASKIATADWQLVLVGAKDDDDHNRYKGDRIQIKRFMSTEDMAKECQSWGVFCLPSYDEPWGVVVHEFAAAGLPLICSDSVGAADTFLIDGENGYLFKAGDIASLTDKIVRIMEKPDAELWQMARRSNELAYRITPEKSAASFMSILNKEHTS